MSALAESIDWPTLVSLEPRLATLEDDARSVEAGPHFCANAVWIKTLKPRMTALVGHVRGPDVAPPADTGPEVLAWGDLMERADEQGRELRRSQSRDRRKGLGLLLSSEAYDVAYDHLYSLLPDCDQGGCLCLPRGRLHAS